MTEAKGDGCNNGLTYWCNDFYLHWKISTHTKDLHEGCKELSRGGQLSLTLVSNRGIIWEQLSGMEFSQKSTALAFLWFCLLWYLIFHYRKYLKYCILFGLFEFTYNSKIMQLSKLLHSLVKHNTAGFIPFCANLLSSYFLSVLSKHWRYSSEQNRSQSFTLSLGETVSLHNVFTGQAWKCPTWNTFIPYMIWSFIRTHT